MQKLETKNYIPLDIEVVEVQIEKGYAATTPTGSSLGYMGNDGAGW